MFSSYQIDLFSKNTSFFHTSSTLFSLNMLSTIQYMMFMPVSEFSKALHFDEHNITKFLERFEKQCNEYEVIDEKR